MERKALGRGLSALIPEKSFEETLAKPAGLQHIKVEMIKPGKMQPRQSFSEEKLDELVASIKEKGVIQPVIVRERDGAYELIAGERRLRAARISGLQEVPVIVKDVNDADALELSLIENIQREELNAIEEAKAYQRLSGEFGFTQDEIAKAVGKDKTTVSNTVRLLGLPKKVQDMVVSGELAMGHARALLGLANEHARLKAAEEIARKGLSVREAEQLVLRRRAPAAGKARVSGKDPKIMAYEEEFQRRLGTKVRIRHGKKRGSIEIEYYSEQDIERILDILR